VSARSVSRALERMAASSCVLAPERLGKGFGVFPNGDRRRRPLVRLSADEVRELESAGVISEGEHGFVLNDAGRARAQREGAAPGEGFVAQHRSVVDRIVMDDDGSARAVRGHDADRTLRRLAGLCDGAGRPWLSADELHAASRLRADWERGEIGLVRGSDWSAPPKGSTSRGPSNDGAMAAQCDARGRVSDALGRLAPPLRAVVERVCLREQGLEELERSEAWPARSGKLALKLALAQLAAG
jgi:hypothetical protein